jgi:cytochrome c-type biogenesis protein CcmF
MTVAHAGMAVTIAGITVSTAWKQEAFISARLGDTLELAGDVYRFDAIDPVAGPNYSAEQATVTVLRDGRTIAVMHPSEKFYPVQRREIRDVAIDTNLILDRYVVLGERQPDNRWVIRVYWNPLVPWVWIGAVIMALGGLLSLSDRRLRIGAPLRRPVPAATAAA